MPTRSGLDYNVYRNRRLRSRYPPGGLWGYHDWDHTHRHRPEDDEEKSVYVRAYKRRPSP